MYYSLKEENLPQCLKSLAVHCVRAVHSLGTPPHNALMGYAKNPWLNSVYGQYISDEISLHKVSGVGLNIKLLDMSRGFSVQGWSLQLP